MATVVLTTVHMSIFEYLTPRVSEGAARVLCYTREEIAKTDQCACSFSRGAYAALVRYHATLAEFDPLVAALRSVTGACRETWPTAVAVCGMMHDAPLVALSFALAKSDVRLDLLQLIMRPRGRVVETALRSVEKVDRFGCRDHPRATSLLHYAVYTGNMRLLRMIAAASAGLPAEPARLRHLYAEGSWEYLPSSPLDNLDAYMATPLMLAVEKRNDEAVALLLAARASVEGFGGERAYDALKTTCSDCMNPLTPLHVACILQDRATTALLLEACADVNPARFHGHEESPLADLVCPNLNSLTPDVADAAVLAWGERRDDLSMARMLLDARAHVEGHGATPGSEGLFHRSALFLAVSGRRYRMVELLLEYKADPHREDSYGDTPVNLLRPRSASESRVQSLLQHAVSVQ